MNPPRKIRTLMKKQPSSKSWFLVENVGKVETPGVAGLPGPRGGKHTTDGENGRQRGKAAATHKDPQARGRSSSGRSWAGIKKFKAATIAEAGNRGPGGRAEVLLAYQPVGPNARRFCETHPAISANGVRPVWWMTWKPARTCRTTPCCRSECRRDAGR